MKWRNDLPTRDGFYFYRSGPGDDSKAIIEIVDGNAVIPCMGRRNISMGVWLFAGPVQWAGPIAEPEEEA